MTTTFLKNMSSPHPTASKGARKSRARVRSSSLVPLAVLWLWTLISVGPLVWMFTNSLRSSTDIVSQPLGAPDIGKADNYVQAWIAGGLGQALLNSVVVSVGAVVIGGFVAYLVGFALSRGGIPFSGLIQTFFLVGLLIPTFSLLIPILLQYQVAGLVSNLFGLTLVYAGFQISLGVFLFKNAFDAIPKDYIEAALLDGASVPRILASVLAPMMRPTIATFGILTFLNSYNDFVFALVLNNDPSLRTLPVAILSFSGIHGTDYGLVFASVSIATLPPLIAYILLRKQVQSSVAMGGRTG